MTQQHMADLRKDYKAKSLSLGDVNPNPIQQFQHWFDEALEAQVPEPNAMTLATCTRGGFPSARIVLLKDVSNEGFTFYTNLESRKGTEMEQNPNVALVFVWLELERQVRIEGFVTKVSDRVATEYFQSRPKSSQIGAWASPQSDVVVDRAELEANYNAMADKYAGHEVLPKPPHWGGYLVIPSLIEFWQGRRSRLHDRLCYTIMDDGSWDIERLAP